MIVWLLWFIIVLCCIGVGRIIWKHIPLIRIIKTETIAQTPQEIKKRLLEKRLERKLVDLGKWSKENIFPKTSQFGNVISRGVENLKNLEEGYRRLLFKHQFSHKVSKQQVIEEKIKQAQKAASAGRLEEAEQTFLQVVALDPHHSLAYRGLGDVYRQQKNYDQAKEIFEFLLKMNDSDPLAFVGLADIAEAKGDLLTATQEYQHALAVDSGNIGTYLALAKTYESLGEHQQAKEIIDQALLIEPRQTALLDFLVEISIILEDKDSAKKAWERLKEANPDNQKLPELRENIKAIK